MASYDEAREAGRIGDYGSGLTDQAGFHDGVRERQAQQAGSSGSGGGGSGLNPLGILALFVLLCGAAAFLYALIARVVAAPVITALTQIFFGTRRRPSLGATNAASYAVSLWGQFAWSLLSGVVVWLVTTFHVEPFSNALMGLGSWVASLSFLNLGEVRPVRYGFSWSSPQTVVALLAVAGPGILAHAALLSRWLGPPYAGVTGFLRAVVASVVASVTGLVAVIALVLITFATTFTLKGTDLPSWVFKYCAIGLLLSAALGTAAAVLVTRVARGRGARVHLGRLCRNAFLGVAGHLALAVIFLLAYAQFTRFYPLVPVMSLAWTQPIPWHYVMSRQHSLGEIRSVLLLSQVPGWLLLTVTSSWSLRTNDRRTEGTFWRSVVLGLVLVVISVASTSLVFSHLSTAAFVPPF